MFNSFLEAKTYLHGRKHLGIKPGLGRVKMLLQVLDHPEKKINGIHVAGTNGKGSTINFIKNALVSNNYRVGVFVSPSAVGLREHMFINDTPIDHHTFVELLNFMYPAIVDLDEQGDHPTEFEIITVLALLFFADSCDFALIETGMGGREDTTNCFHPLLSIITNVSLDHVSFLGNTVDKIAIHKAGILKYKIPAIIGPMSDKAMKVIQEIAEANKVNLSRFGKEFKISGGKDNYFSWGNQLYKELDVSLKMIGRHQHTNAAIAIMAIVKLIELGYLLDIDSAVGGVENTRVSGRFELIYHKPQIFIDGAHNESGVQAFVETVNSVSMQQKKKHVIFAAFKDKDIGSMLKLLEENFDKVILTTFDHPRAASITELKKYADSVNFVIRKDWKQEINETLNSSNFEIDFFVTGSLDFILSVRSFIAK
ncbi:bifunctional folylpolyglutamate synthase/dihydrofolate synthase [Virgibacillus sp. DJP39]|uniref:bifunctional folylpolyglutamate synthase/dihydrofolate synthase n=1 Tax=Virgibacillus sp. DJP39 TaxID=3409790 RepID=UPI003BB73F30